MQIGSSPKEAKVALKMLSQLVLADGVLHPDEARRMISERHSGVSKGGWKPWVLQNGGEVKNVTTSNEQGCLPEVLAHSIRDTANWFGVPPHRIGDTTRTSFSSLEEEASRDWLKIWSNVQAGLL